MLRIFLPLIFAVATNALVAQVEVVGDAKLLSEVRDSNLRHQKSLASGLWVGKISRGDSKGKVAFSWQGDNSRMEYDLTSSSTLGGRPESGLAIRKAAEQFIYFKSQKMANHYNGLGRNFISPLEYHPRNCWYVFHEVFPWADLLDHENPRGAVTKFKVLKAPDDYITIERHHADGSWYEIIVSKKLDNRIVKFNSRDDVKGGTSYSTEIEWVKSKSGLVYPKKLRNWKFASGEKRGAPSLQVETEAFSAEKFELKQFDTKNSDFPRDTKFNYFNADGTVRELPAVRVALDNKALNRSVLSCRVD